MLSTIRFRNLLLSTIAVVLPLSTSAQFGPNSPATTANNNTIGANNWANTARVISDNNSRATVGARGISRYLSTTNYGFAIPLTHTIDGIEVEIDRRAQTPGNAVAILNTWSTGTTKTISAGTDRCLVVIAATENGNGPTNVTAMTYGGQSMTQVGEFNVGTAGGFNNRIEVWILLNAGIAAAANTTIVPTLSATSFVENVQLYSSAVFQDVDQYNTISDIESSSVIGATNPYQLGTAVTTIANGLTVGAILCGDNTTPQVANGGTNTYTINSGFTEGTDIYFSNPGFATSGSSLQTSTKSNAAVGTEQPTFTFNGTPNRQVAVGFSLRPATALDNSVRLIKGGVIVGSNYAKTNVAWPTADAYETYGGPTDLWGTTWTPAEINANNFGVVLSGIVQGSALQVDHIRITVYTSFVAPIDLLFFKGNTLGEHVQLEWQTVSEKNNDFFTVERADHHLDFKPIATIDGAGNSTQPLFYTAKDTAFSSQTTYYRLKQTDYDGQFSYSAIIAVNTGKLVEELVFYPNPANTEINVLNFKDESLHVRILTQTGAIILETNIDVGLNTIDVSGFQQGLYLVETTRGREIAWQKISVVR